MLHLTEDNWDEAKRIVLLQEHYPEGSYNKISSFPVLPTNQSHYLPYLSLLEEVNGLEELGPIRKVVRR